MSEIKLTLNVLMSLIIQSKKTGSGKIGNGRILVKLLQIIADNKGEERTHERNILACFNDDVNKSESYHKIDKLIGRFLPQGRFYPYKKFSFTKFESCIGNDGRIAEYLRKMRSFCDEVIDAERLDQLAYTLLRIMRQDSNISIILYGSEFISKEKLFGSYVNPKRICIDSLLLGLLYHVHKNPMEGEKIELLEIPARRTIQTVRFGDENCLDTELLVDFLENICETAKHQKSAELKYKPHIRYENEDIAELPDSGNIFLYGTGGAGKSTLSLNQIGNKNTINFYFPLYKYKREIHENLQSENCWILLQILLKYHYQYEYQTYETLIANEGENAVLQQLSELVQTLKNNPDNWNPRYVLLLDGLNEMSSELQEDFADELACIVNSWKNIHIIVTGRNVPGYDVFKNFCQIEVCGITDLERDAALSDFNEISSNENLMEILKIPMFLNMYLESQRTNKTLNTRGEILDSYIMQQSFQNNGVMRFILKYALPFVANRMFGWNYIWIFPFLSFSYDISRADLLAAIDEAIDFYLMNERIYQNYIAPQKINKKHIIRFRRNSDMVEAILEQLCFMQSSSDIHRLIFSHQYYRDYFAAKYILNLIDAIDKSYENDSKKRFEILNECGLTHEWYGGYAWWYDMHDVYRLIGEVCGDYKNIASDNFVYHRTALDRLLDMVRDYETYRTSENIILTMSSVRNNIICGVDFSKMKLPLFMPSDICFSNKGLYPSCFRKSIVFGMTENEYKKFLNCDFREVLFFKKKDKENLRKMGAIVD